MTNPGLKCNLRKKVLKKEYLNHLNKLTNKLTLRNHRMEIILIRKSVQNRVYAAILSALLSMIKGVTSDLLHLFKYKIPTTRDSKLLVSFKMK